VIPLIGVVRDWYCPNCGLRDQTREPRPHSRFHVCPRLRGLTAPMLPVGVAAKVEARDREDYAGREVLTKDENGRPVMSVVTTRDDGTDAIVFAPLAQVRADA
jgi:hypothetical protein